MTLSGWCSGPIGTRPQCDACRSERCGCGCHDEKKEGDMSTFREARQWPIWGKMMGTTKAAPGGASTPLLQGPRRSAKEID